MSCWMHCKSWRTQMGEMCVSSSFTAIHCYNREVLFNPSYCNSVDICMCRCRVMNKMIKFQNRHIFRTKESFKFSFSNHKYLTVQFQISLSGAIEWWVIIQWIHCVNFLNVICFTLKSSQCQTVLVVFGPELKHVAWRLRVDTSLLCHFSTDFKLTDTHICNRRSLFNLNVFQGVIRC